MSNYPFFKNPRPTRMVIFYSDKTHCVYPDVHISAIINSICNEGVSQVQFMRGQVVAVDIFDQQSALKFARSLPENHSYDKIIVFRDKDKR